MSDLRLLVVTSCTSQKRFKPENQLKREDFDRSEYRQQREQDLVEYKCAASHMYTGLQHRCVLEGVRYFRQILGESAVNLDIISAAYGLISEHQEIVPYEVTFNTFRQGREVDEWANFLRIHEEFEKAIASSDLVFILLGNRYLRSLSLPVKTHKKQTLIFLTSNGSASLIPNLEAKTFVMPLTNTEAKRYSYALVGLKGFLLKQFAKIATTQSEVIEQVYREPKYFEQAIDENYRKSEVTLNLSENNTENSRKSRIEVDVFSGLHVTAPENRSLPKKSIEKVEKISPDLNLKLPAAPNIHLGMQYFIPEWDDFVDPKYCFQQDLHPANRQPYIDDIYAHEIYSTPNYDGILVSKVVVDKSQTKKQRIYEIGIHKYIRIKSMKIMGDCGAFGYISEDLPPYTTEEILEYYEKLGFDYGVSIDHLIVGKFAQPGIREKRYELTRKNSEEFIQKHRSGGYSFEPIGVVQGWDANSYAQAVKANIEMGYTYIALGGLARAKSTEIIEILEAIQPHLTSNIRLHLFGVGRVSATSAFRHLGVTSFDSASSLRSAWLDSKANYHTLSGKTYAAIRIPPVNKPSLRIQQILKIEISDIETLKKLEQNSLKSLREFEKGQLSLENTLDAILAYDELLELPRDGEVKPEAKARRLAKHALMYEELLTDKPWKACDCPICYELGIEVVIFRGNDRNRRRGFHNTYVFYKRFQELLKQ
jgi:Queuine tRNA-ribosyltransferase